MLEPNGVAAEAPDFVSLLAHELAQPLTAAVGCVATLSEHGLELDDGDRKLMIDAALRNLTQLQSLIDSLRVFSNVSGGQIPLKRSDVALADLFDEVVEDFGTPPDGKSLLVGCHPSLRVKVDIMLFRQVLANLIANARKFGTVGSTIELSAVPTGDAIEITVYNEGSGFPTAESDRIFGRSVRLDLGKRGLGLGLYIARSIIEAHGGELWAESVEGMDATFHIDLPRVDALKLE